MARRSAALLGAAVLAAGGVWLGPGGAAAGSAERPAPAATTKLRAWPSAPTVASVAAAESAAAGARAARRPGQTLAVVTREVRSAFVDLPPAGDSAGDFFLVEERVFDRTGTRPIGRDAVRCELGLRTFTCAATIEIDGKGKIRVAGTLFRDGDNVVPVTGGTGAYEGVGGELTVFDLAGGRTALVFHLVR
jgi:hypothetical protein